jgi:carboxypeptidase X2
MKSVLKKAVVTHTSICLEALRQTTKIFRTLYVLVGISAGHSCSASQNLFYPSNLLGVDPAVCPFEKKNLAAVRKFVGYFLARSHNCEKRLLASSCLPVCPSARLPVCPSARLPVCPSVLMSARKNADPTGRISINLGIFF